MEQKPRQQSVRQLIEEYNRQLMETYQKQAPAAVPAAAPVTAPPAPSANWLDERYPAPDLRRDMNGLSGADLTQPSSAVSSGIPDIPAEPGTPLPPNVPETNAYPDIPFVAPIPPRSKLSPPVGVDPNTSGQTFSGREETAPTYPYSDGDLRGRVPFPVEPTRPQTGPAPYVGYLQVFVFTAQEAEPLANAQVTVTRNEGDAETVYASAVTDRDGKTPVFSLPSVNPALTMQPESAPPYMLYNVQVNLDGFIPTVYEDLPIYGENHVTQPAAMVPVIPGGVNAPRVFRSRGPADL